jgi:hypothetical protein
MAGVSLIIEKRLVYNLQLHSARKQNQRAGGEAQARKLAA